MKAVEARTIDETQMLDITKNLMEFQKTNAFQSGIISFIANVQSNVKDLEDLGQMFRRLDTSKDGKLQISELKAGLDELKEFFQYQEIDYEDLLRAMDSDGDGEIDFTEFISAAFDKRALLT